MNIKEWAKHEIELAKLVGYVEITDDMSEEDRGFNRLTNSYGDSVYDHALELFNKFADQDHSGLSASLVVQVFNILAKLETLTPLTGDDDEWDRDNVLNAAIEQNKRNSAVFRSIADGEYTYSYNNIVNVANEDDVWSKYPPVGDNGILDDTVRVVSKYFDAYNVARNKHNSEIKFPYMPVTYSYLWDFKEEKLIPINRISRTGSV